MLRSRLLALSLVSFLTVAGDWPHWRGPDANGISPETGVPVRWSQTENIAWKVPLPGLGTSTPIVSGELVVVTSQIGDGPLEGRGRDFELARPARSSGERDRVEFTVQAYHRDTGKLGWEARIQADGDLTPVHMKHNLSSPSVITDSTLFYAWMGTGQLLALDRAGKTVWQRHLGKEVSPFEILWGHGSSPALYKDKLILLCDHAPASYLLALDKNTGRTIWKADRGSDRRSYSTPFVISVPGGDQLIINSTERIDAYDPATGKLLWWTDEPNRVPIGMPVFHDGILYATRGYSSGPYMALRPGGKGELPDAATVWRVPTGAPYVSSLLYYRGQIYMANERGIVTVADAETGRTLWRERMGGDFAASPVAADGKVYLTDSNGDTFVLEAGPEKKLLAKNPLGERILASLAIAAGRIYLRSDDHLYAIGR